MPANGHHETILDNYAIQRWLIYSEVENGMFQNTGFCRGTYFEANAKAYRISQDKGFGSFFLTLVDASKW